MAAAADYIPPALAGQVIAHTKLLGPKQTDEIKFTAPTEPECRGAFKLRPCP